MLCPWLIASIVKVGQVWPIVIIGKLVNPTSSLMILKTRYYHIFQNTQQLGTYLCTYYQLVVQNMLFEDLKNVSKKQRMAFQNSGTVLYRLGFLYKLHSHLFTRSNYHLDFHFYHIKHESRRSPPPLESLLIHIKTCHNAIT